MFEDFARVEYPKNIADNAMPQNTIYYYVGYTFLNALSNYIKPFYVIGIERYENWDETDLNKEIQKLADDFHTNYLRSFFDDVILLGESDVSYWYLWIDKDVSDCFIGRFSKEKITKEKMKKDVIEHFKQCKKECNCKPTEDIECITGRYIELPLPRVWWSCG